jgi:hypothetical protein
VSPTSPRNDDFIAQGRYFSVWDYVYRTHKLEGVRRLEVNERTAAYVRELIKRTLEEDWWKRPTAGDVLQLLESLTNPGTSGLVYYLGQPESELDSSAPLQPVIDSLSPTPAPRAFRFDKDEILSNWAPSTQIFPITETGAALLLLRTDAQSPKPRV